MSAAAPRLCLLANPAGPDRGDARAGQGGLRELALRAGTGDAVALTELVRATSSYLWSVCARLVDRASADDLTQDTYARAVRSLPTYRGQAEPTAWLAAIARRVCADEIGRRQRARHLEAQVRSERVCEAAEPTVSVELADAIARLAPERREAFYLTAVAGFSYAEAADMCGCPVGTIRSRVARAKQELSGILRAGVQEPARAAAGRLSAA